MQKQTERDTGHLLVHVCVIVNGKMRMKRGEKATARAVIGSCINPSWSLSYPWVLEDASTHTHTDTQIHTHTYIKNTCQYTSIHTVHLFEHHTEMWFYSLYFFYILKEWVTFFNPCGQNKFVIPLVTVATAPCAVRQPFSTVFMLLVVTFQFLYIDIYFFPSFLLSWNLLLFAVMLGWTIEWDYHALALGLWE